MNSHELLTFGVIKLTTIGTATPIIQAIVPMMPVIIPAKFGLRSNELIIIDDVSRPLAPTATATLAPTSIGSQPAYAATNMNTPLIVDAVTAGED